MKIKTHGLRSMGRLFLNDGKEKGGRSRRLATKGRISRSGRLSTEGRTSRSESISHGRTRKNTEKTKAETRNQKTLHSEPDA